MITKSFPDSVWFWQVVMRITVLIDQLEKYGEEIPFLATIRKINKYYSLT